MALLPFVSQGHPEQSTPCDCMCWSSSEVPDEAFVFSCAEAAALQCNESEHCARGDVGISGEGGTVSEICESYEEASLLFLLLPTTQSLRKITFADKQILWFVS